MSVQPFVNTALVLAGHGSRSAEANASLTGLAASLEARLGAHVAPAFLEMTEPSIPAAIDRLAERGVREIVLIPYFLHPGMHVRRDLVEIADEARARHPHLEIVLAPFLGSDPAIADVLAGLAQRVLDERREGSQRA